MTELILQNAKPLRDFTKHLFLVSKVYINRNMAKLDIDEHLNKMKKSIIRMNLSYSDVEKLKKKIDNLLILERKFAKYFRTEDEETEELKNHIKALEQQLSNERESKLSIISEYDEKTKELSESLNNIKNNMKHLLVEKAKRQHRLRVLEEKISNKVDVHKYYKN